MADKQVKIEVTTEANLDKVQSLENEINKLKKQKIQLDIETNTSKLEDVNSKIESTKAKLQELKGKADVDDSEIKQLEQELAQLESDKINLEIAVETGKLEAARMEAESLDGTTIDVDVNNISAMEAVDQIGQGFDRLKQGASEIGAQLGTVLEAAGKQETNKTFLEMSVGADQAAKSLETINGIVRDLPGDDTALQGLLSSAAAKNASLTAEELRGMGTAAADYFSAMSYYGKSSTEAQQDMTNYILAGNTAELERSPILQGHIDKLKQATTVQERSKALQEALNEEGWGGMSMQDTYNNKLETFNGMLERGRYNLGGMFQEGAKAGMDFLLQLDSATGGLVGMGIAMAQFASPITDVVMGLGQIATGLNALKDAGDLLGLKSKLESVKNSLSNVANYISFNVTKAFETMKFAATNAVNSLRASLTTLASSARTAAASALTSLRTGLTTVATAARSAATSLIAAGRAALTSAANAVRSAAMWVAEKAAKIASTAASYALAAAQAVLNAVMAMNPIMLIVIAIAALVAALIWAYNNVDWFREGVNNAWQKLQEFAGFIMGVVNGALQGLGDAFNNAGQIMQEAFNSAVETVMGVLQGLFDYITSAGGLIPENVTLTGNQIIDALLGIMVFIQTLPLQIAMVFINVIAQALGFGQNFSQTMMANAMNAINGFITWMATLPSRAYTYLSQTLSRVVSWGASLASNFLSAASKSVSNFGSQIAQIPQRLGSELSSALDRVNEWAATLPAKFWQAGVDAVKNFLSALGIASPGTMQRMLVWEVSEMGKRVPEESRQLLTNVGRLGENIVDEFGEPTLGVNFDDTANASFTNLTEGQTRANVINLNLEIGSVDNEDRIQEIVEAVRKELAWNNLLAGRTVDDI